MKNIVVGYDGSETAGRAVDEAATLARGLGARLHVIHIVDNDRLRQGMVTTDIVQDVTDAALESNQALLGSDALDGVDAQAEVLHGPPSRTMIKYADSVEADLIVVGNRRVQGLERLLGSVSVDVLRHAPCSVYVAHTAG